MKKSPSVLSFMILAALFSASAMSTEEEDLHRAKAEYEFGVAAEAMAKKCEVEPKVSINWNGFPKSTERFSVASYCGEVLDALRRHCETPAKRAYIKKVVRKVECQHGKSKKVSIKRKEGTVIFEMSLESSNLGEKAAQETLRSL